MAFDALLVPLSPTNNTSKKAFKEYTESLMPDILFNVFIAMLNQLVQSVNSLFWPLTRLSICAALYK